MNSPALRGTDLSRVFPGTSRRPAVAAVDGVSLTIAPGSRLALIGRSGSGKSTLLRLLLALDRPTSGTVTYGDRAVTVGPTRRLRWYRQRVQYIPQDPVMSLDPHMTVEQLVTDPLRHLRVEGDHTAIARRALEDVHLGVEFLRRRRDEISGGQAQRVAIARALATGATVLLADEPVSGLDRPLRDEVLGLLAHVSASRGTSILMVTHDLEAADRLCSDGMVMHAGKVVEQGPMPRLLTAPQHEETRLLLQAATLKTH